MTGSALNRKLVRETWRMRGQLLSIALVVAAGITTVVTLRGTYVSLATSLERFYTEYRFADVFAELSRAPEHVSSTIAELEGVARVTTRVQQLVNLDVPGLAEPAVGLIVSLPQPGVPALNEIHLVSGRPPEPDAPDEVLLSESFALANGLDAGSSVSAVINGRRRTLSVVGIAISPDYIGEIAPGAVFPDDRRFGILRMNRHALSAVSGMEGAFNTVFVELSRSASEPAVIAALDRILEPYGGRGAYGRGRHPSHAAVTGELDQNRVTGTVIPAIFFGVAVFLLNIVLGRIVATQRDEIAILKAFGYTNGAIGRHYLGFALSAVVLGAALGIGAGLWLGDGFTQLYARYFRFPSLEYRVAPDLLLSSLAISVTAAALGALGAVRSAVRLPPAQAMQPEAPMRARHDVLRTLGLSTRLSASTRLIVRNVERRPLRATFAAVGVALAIAILVVSMFLYDAVEHMVAVQFGDVQRESLSVYFVEDRGARVRYDLQRLPGVTAVELFRSVPVRLRSAHVERTVALTGMEPGGQIRRIVDQAAGPLPVPMTGVVLTSTLANLLGIRVGDTVRAERLDGRRTAHALPVVATVDELFGLNAYIGFGELHRILGESPRASGAWLSAQQQGLEQLNRTIKDLPAVLSAYSPAVVRATFEEQMDETLLISVAFLVTLAGILAVGIIYNGARIALSERGRELASLRVLGFSRREVSTLLLGEQAIITAAAVPLGWLAGFGLGAFVLTLFNQEQYRVPLVVTPQTYVYSAGIAVAAAFLAGVAVRRRIGRLDLVEVLKTRE